MYGKKKVEEEGGEEEPVAFNGPDIFQEPFMNRLIGLSNTLTKVIVNIRKFPFGESAYKKYVQEFGTR